MTEGLVSTIIPVFNRPAMLREAVDSVLAQTWRPIEIVIVDDGSTDDTLSVAHELRADHPHIILVLSQPNAGPGVARQTGLEAASGEFIQFLDSDDLLLRDKFSLQVLGLREDAEAGISYGKTYTSLAAERAATPAQRTGEQHRHIFPALLCGRLWETSTPLYRRSALDRIGPWPRKSQMEDWQFDAHAGAAGIMLHYCDAYIAEYRIHNEHRLAHAWMSSAAAMSDRISAYVEILRCAQHARVPHDAPELQRYGRTLFWVARNAGERKFFMEADQLLGLVQQLSNGQPARAFEVWLFRRLTALFGWTAMATLGRLLE